MLDRALIPPGHLGLVTPAPMLITEHQLGKAPFEVHLVTSKKARAGSHTLQFLLTYFNGEVWKTSVRDATIVVPSFYERHTVALWAVGIVVAIFLTVLSAVLGVILTPQEDEPQGVQADVRVGGDPPGSVIIQLGARAGTNAGVLGEAKRCIAVGGSAPSETESVVVHV